MFVQQAGQVVEVSAREARRMVDGDQAEPAPGEKWPAEFSKPGSAAVEGEPGFEGHANPANGKPKGRSSSPDDDDDALS
jgi:hypothetical protein